MELNSSSGRKGKVLMVIKKVWQKKILTQERDRRRHACHDAIRHSSVGFHQTLPTPRSEARNFLPVIPILIGRMSPPPGTSSGRSQGADFNRDDAHLGLAAGRDVVCRSLSQDEGRVAGNPIIRARESLRVNSASV